MARNTQRNHPKNITNATCANLSKNIPSTSAYMNMYTYLDLNIDVHV